MKQQILIASILVSILAINSQRDLANILIYLIIESKINIQIEHNLTSYISKAAVYENGYLPPTFSFITKTDKEGKISFSIIFDKDITESNNISISMNGKLENITREIKKGAYNFEFTVEPNEISSIQIESSYYYNDEHNRKVSFKLNNLKVR